MSYLKQNSFGEEDNMSYLLTPQSVAKALGGTGSVEQMRCLLGFAPPCVSTLATKIWVKRSQLVLPQLCSMGSE